VTSEHRYALDALLDALGLPFDERAADAARAEELDEVYALLTLAHEAEAELDEHGRPIPPAEPPGPRVGDLAAELARRLGVERRGFPGGDRFLVALTHDVDLLGGRAGLRKLAAGFLLRPRSASARRRRREGSILMRDALAGRDPVFPLDELVAVEREHGWRSTCFFLARQVDPHDGYPKRYRRALPRALEDAGAAGLEIGLHASYRAREDPGALELEADLLERVAGARARGVRFHYLRSDPPRLGAELEPAGLRYDSSIGWPSLPGLRAGTPYPYRLWDEARRRPGGWELPLAVMDATLSEPRYLGLGAEEGFERAVAALEPVAQHGGAVALLWHPPSHHPRLSNRYDEVYRRLLAWIADRGGWAGTAADALDHWQLRRAQTQ
jgi:peptidoglycan/xylan/chitin deacetylase (PgdA/CDA1 family)